MMPPKRSLPLAMALSALLMASAAYAANTSGTWNTTASPSSWNVAACWASNGIADGAGQTADFSTLNLAGTTTVTLDGTRTIGNLTFGDTDTTTGGSWKLSAGTGGPLTLAGTTPTITVNALANGQYAEISTPIAGTGGLTKSGGGTLKLTGGLTNALTGAINIQAGTLQISDGTSHKGITGPVTVASGATFAFGQNNINNNNLTNSLSLSGAGNGGIGALLLSAGVTATGNITLDDHATISHDWNGTSVNGSITGANKNLTLNSTASGQPALTINGVITLGTGSLIKTGANGVKLTQANSYSGGTQLVAGTLTFTNAGALGSGAVSFTGNATLQPGLATTLNDAIAISSGVSGTIDTNGYDTTLSGAISGSGNLIKSGNGKLTLSGANTYTGTTTVAAGTLAWNGANHASAITLASGSSLSFTLGTTVVSSSSVDFGSGTIKVVNTPTLTSYTLMTAAGGFIGTPVLNVAIPGYTLALVNGGTELRLVTAATATTVPTVTGTLQADAVAAIQSAGLAVGTVVTEPSVLVPVGKIIRQSPSGGVSVLQGSAVDLVVSLGDTGPPYDKYFYRFDTGNPETFVASDQVNNTPRDLILAAINSGATDVTIPPGIYRMTPPPGDASIINITNANNLTIHADHVVILCNVMTRAVNISNCSNLVIDGLTIDYAPTAFPYTQGEIIATGTEGNLRTIDVRLHAGYPLAAWSRLQVFDPVLRTNVSRDFTWGAVSEMLDASQRMVRIKDANLGYAQVGQLITMASGYPSGSIPHTVCISDCGVVSMSNVTIHTSISFGIIHATSYGGGTFQNVKIVRGPLLPGATEPRLLTTMHDGWKISALEHGITVENCVIEHTGDDAWSTVLHNHLVAGINGNRIILLSNEGSTHFRNGFHLRRGVLDPEVQISNIVQYNTAASWSALRSIADPATIDKVEAANGSGYYGYSKAYFELELAGPPTFNVGETVTVRERQCDGYVFRNNRLDSTGRLLLCGGSHALIENNEFIRVHSIKFSPDQSGLANGMTDVTFRNNRLEHVNQKENTQWNGAASGSFAMSEVDQNGNLRTSPLFDHFDISNNQFIDCQNGNLNLTGASNLTIKDNRFINPGLKPTTTGGAQYPFDQAYVMNLFNSSNVAISGNTLEDPGIYCKGIINAVNVTYVTDPAPTSPPFSYVNSVNDAPVFYQNPINMPDAFVGTLYKNGAVFYTLASSAGDADQAFGDNLTYSLVSGPSPAWLTIAPDGTLQGTPAAANAGLNTFTVKVRDAAQAESTATLKILVGTNLTWDGGGPLDNWSDPVNWNASGNDKRPDTAFDTALFNYSGDIQMDVDGNYTVRKFTDGFPSSANQIVRLSGTGTLTFDGNSSSAYDCIANVTGGTGSRLVLDCGVIISNNLGGETHLGIGNSASNVICFGPNSTLSLQSLFNTYTGSGTIEFNGRILSGTQDLGLAGNVLIGTGHDSSAFNRDILLNTNCKLTVAAGIVLSSGRKIQIQGTGVELKLNGANVIRGADIMVMGSNNLLINANANQDNLGTLDMATGTVTIDLGAVSLIAFANSSSKEWTGGSVVITHFIPDVVRFGTADNGLTPAQLALIKAYDGNGILIDGLRLNGDGYLTIASASNGETPISGVMSGTYLNTRQSDNLYQTLTEVEQAGSETSQLEHKWVFHVTGGTHVVFKVEAHHTINRESDDFLFAYSTGGVNGPYVNMLMVTKTSDDNTAQSFLMPSGTSGMVHVRVVDTNRSAGRNVLDTLYIDQMQFLTEVSSGTLPLSDYATWVARYGNPSLNNPEADFDGDGIKNGDERVWGLDPTQATSSRPIINLLDPVSGAFRYKRRDRALSMLNYSVWTSTNLQDWTEDSGAQQSIGPPDADGAQTVDVILSPSRLGGPKLFCQIRATQ